jgi:lipoyl synthase
MAPGNFNNKAPENTQKNTRKPHWLKVKLPSGENYLKVRSLVNDKKLSTICQSGSCPNMGECWGAGTATFMILGNVCTRTCTFCSVPEGKPMPPDYEEPLRVAESVKLMNLKHCVVTSVTRDDLPDKGAEIWALTIKNIRTLNPLTTIEVLIPDMKSDNNALSRIMEEKPEVISHNMETVKRLYPTVRPQANYRRSLEQIKIVHNAGIRSKSGFMAGLGEKEEEILQLINDLSDYNADILTIGQYLQPSPLHHPVIAFITPEKFGYYREYALKKGIRVVESAPLVRSSYHSEKHIF